jgi:HAE1 family hydrophobic/amphiphilic exporter-1
VDYPTIQVNAGLPGADPETMATSVATPLERQFSTIAGIESMSSASSQGGTSITIQFALDRNNDAAAQDVQAAISAATGDASTGHAAASFVSKSESRGAAVLYLALTSKTLPLYTWMSSRKRSWRNASP